MNSTLHTASEAVVHDIATACERIAPTWPLDQFIALAYVHRDSLDELLTVIDGRVSGSTVAA